MPNCRDNHGHHFKTLSSAHATSSHGPPDLEEAFQKSKEAIVEAIRPGCGDILTPRSALVSAPTGSKRGIGLLSYSSNTAVVHPVSPIVAPEDGQITLGGITLPVRPLNNACAAIEGESPRRRLGPRAKPNTSHRDANNLIVVHRPQAPS